MRKPLLILLILFTCTCQPKAQQSGAGVERHPELFTEADTITMADEQAVATFGAGCFWCVEAIFQRLNGVKSVVSGFSGGHVSNPTYQQVITGSTGHAEVIQITYDPELVTYARLLEIFWMTHDPTTLNRQGNDVGPQYRSAVFYHNEEQKRLAEHYKMQIDAAEVYPKPIVTEITPFEAFFEADDYHQNYFNNNPDQAYCSFVIRPKVEKFKKIFSDRLAEPGNE